MYDAITACDFFMTGVQDNERFGLQGWIEEWDGAQDPYKFGQELSEDEKKIAEFAKQNAGLKDKSGRLEFTGRESNF